MSAVTDRGIYELKAIPLRMAESMCMCGISTSGVFVGRFKAERSYRET